MVQSPLVSTAGQLRWLDAELGLFCHFGINTFYDKELSDGSLDLAGFVETPPAIRVADSFASGLFPAMLV